MSLGTAYEAALLNPERPGTEYYKRSVPVRPKTGLKPGLARCRAQIFAAPLSATPCRSCSDFLDGPHPRRQELDKPGACASCQLIEMVAAGRVQQPHPGGVIEPLTGNSLPAGLIGVVSGSAARAWIPRPSQWWSPAFFVVARDFHLGFFRLPASSCCWLLVAPCCSSRQPDVRDFAGGSIVLAP